MLRAIVLASLVLARVDCAWCAEQVHLLAPTLKSPSETANDSAPDAPLPPEKSILAQGLIAGRPIHYHATVGSVPIVIEGRLAGEVAYVAYTVDASGNRPLTFVFNGGPGASAGFLNVGAIGPKRVQFGAKGDAPSDSLALSNNPNSWLDMTDLVFIDPIGTGFSRSHLGAEETKKAFYGVDQDARYLAEVIYEWTKRHGRMQSDKYLVGESYGGYRVPRIVSELQLWLGVGVRGMVLLSPYFESSLQSPVGEETAQVSPMPWVMRLPTMAAANYELKGVELTPERMAEVEEYAIGEFAAAYMRGWSNPADLERMVQRVATYSGLDVDTVRTVGGRIEQNFFLRERFKKERMVGGRYDVNVPYFDPDPWAPTLRSVDSVAATFTIVGGAMTDFITHVVGWMPTGQYLPYNPTIVTQWDGFANRPMESLSVLRAVLSLDPKMQLLAVNGYSDMACPYFASKLVLNQIPPMGSSDRVRFRAYPGGHMFYSRPDSGRQFKADASTIYRGPL